MGKIFCLMGKSSTGKDTIYKALLQDKEMELRHIVSYTTRPIRAGENNGTEYFFTDDRQLQEYRKNRAVIEERAYTTYYGIWYYFTVADEQIDLHHHNYLIIGTPESFLAVREYFGQEKVVPILITVDDGVRLQRALNREKKQKEPRYEEMCRRFLADSADFAADKIKEAGINRAFINENLDECMKNIKRYITENR